MIKMNLALSVLIVTAMSPAFAQPSSSVNCSGIKARLLDYQNSNNKLKEKTINTVQDIADVLSGLHSGWSQNEGQKVLIPYGFFSNLSDSARIENNNATFFRSEADILSAKLNDIVVDVAVCLAK